MRDRNWFFGGLIVGLIVGALATIQFYSGAFMWRLTPYKQGQIDAMTSKIRYEIAIHPDSTRTWEWKEGQP